MTDRELEQRAEEYAFNHGTPHTKRDMPAWFYSIRDFLAGAHSQAGRVEELEKHVAELKAKIKKLEGGLDISVSKGAHGGWMHSGPCQEGCTCHLRKRDDK